MKKIAATIALASLVAVTPLAAYAGMDMDMDHGSMKMDHGSMMGHVVHKEVVNGVKASFSVMDIKAKMQQMGMKETHHIMVTFTDAKTGKPLAAGEAKLKVIGPDKKSQVKDLMAMENGFGSDVTMPKPGKYGVITKFKAADGKVRIYKFWYTVK